jgi:hypothetical protein
MAEATDDRLRLLIDRAEMEMVLDTYKAALGLG